MSVTYGTTAIPSDQHTVLEGDTVDIGAAFENTVGLIGGMDVSNGDANPGEVYQIESPSEAQTMFGDQSELHIQTQLAYQQGSVGLVYALAVSESETTESFSTTSSGTLGNDQVLDPRIHPEHDITAQDTTEGVSVDVVIVDEDPPTAPSDANTINLNPVTQDWEADESSSYDITYTHGDFSSEDIGKVVDEDPRKIAVLTESSSVINTADTEITDAANGYDFMTGVYGAEPLISDFANYTDSLNSRRASLVYSSRGYIDDAQTDEQRTAGAVAAEMCSVPLGRSTTNNSINGFTALKNAPQSPQDASDLTDAQVLPVYRDGEIEIVKDMTTSTTQKFERVYAMDVIDEATEISHGVSKQFIGEQNTQTTRNNLRRSHINAYIGMVDTAPPQLDGFSINVSEDTSNDNKVNVEIGLSVVDVMDIIDVTMTVGDIIGQPQVA